jgi:hypothetical protein
MKADLAAAARVIPLTALILASRLPFYLNLSRSPSLPDIRDN